LVRDRSLPGVSPAAPPLLHRRPVGERGPVTPRLGHRDDARIAPGLQIAATDLRTSPRQVVRATLDLEQDVGRVERLDRLDGELARIADADPDHEQPPHLGSRR
jgi:hypothetical protein